MAVAESAREDLDEMLREEAEDVFYEDGRLAGSVRGPAGGRLKARRLVCGLQTQG